MRVLFVEDNADVRELVGLMLEDVGLDVVACASAEEAEVHFERQPFDLLFTDISLPGRSGVDLARSLLPRAPALWVVFSSGFATSKALTTLGPRVRILLKPFEFEDLERLIDEINGDARAVQGAGAN